MENQKISKNLPLDMITEVLFRLPMKALLQFQCVSKQWYGLISSSSFKNLYDIYQRCRKPNKLLLLNLVSRPGSDMKWLRLQVVDLMIKAKQEQVYSEFSFQVPCRIGHNSYYAYSCHGLVCYASRLEKEIYVINPSTKLVIELPEPPDGFLTSDAPYGRRVSIGFLSSTNQYKIVSCYLMGHSIRIGVHDYYHEICFEIFTLTTKDASKISESSSHWNWTKKVYPAFGYSLRMIQRPGRLSISVYIDGVIYWLITLGTSESSEPGNSKQAVLAFDLDTEEAKIIPCRDDCYSTTVVSLTELRGYLCILVALEREVWGISGWMLKPTLDASDNWVKLRDVHEEFSRPFGCATTTQVMFLNIESRKFQYLNVEQENKDVKYVYRFSDDYWEVSNFVLVYHKRFQFRGTWDLLFSESFFSLN